MQQNPSSTRQFFFNGQITHLLLLLILLVAAVQSVDFNQLRERQFWGIGADLWFAISLAVPIIHQVFVWLAWRSELCYGTLARWFGSHAFTIYEILFFILFMARPISLIILTIADHNSFELPPSGRVVICVLLGLPAVYTFYSVVRYFGMARAAGIDHFDKSYRSKPFVKKGIFRYTSNSMYSFAFLIFWVIAIAGASWAALIVAIFSHAYIWVHYFSTERPDMKVIYG